MKNLLQHVEGQCKIILF